MASCSSLTVFVLPCITLHYLCITLRYFELLFISFSFLISFFGAFFQVVSAFFIRCRFPVFVPTIGLCLFPCFIFFFFPSFYSCLCQQAFLHIASLRRRSPDGTADKQALGAVLEPWGVWTDSRSCGDGSGTWVLCGTEASAVFPPHTAKEADRTPETRT